MDLSFINKIYLILLWVQIARSTSPTYLLNNDNDPESDIVAMLPSKEYPREKDFPKSAVIPRHDDDATYLLSKLSNQELIMLLNAQPDKENFDLTDIVKLSSNVKSIPENLNNDNIYQSLSKAKKREQSVSRDQNMNSMRGYFKLNHKEVEPYNIQTGVDPNYLVFQKIQNLLHSRSLQHQDLANLNSDDKKELLFDMLTAQLRKLCCQPSKPKKANGKKQSYKPILNKRLALNKNILSNNNQFIPKTIAEHEHMFLIINDEINNYESDDLISVDPESLNKNSSVLLLGPIMTPLTESQLKLVMNRITNELSKPEYLPLMRQIAGGKVSDANTRLVKSLISGPETRRYIKPHRCNHQSKLAKIYGGPKWLICTGYLNLNTPSLYD